MFRVYHRICWYESVYVGMVEFVSCNVLINCVTVLISLYVMD